MRQLLQEVGALAVLAGGAVSGDGGFNFLKLSELSADDDCTDFTVSLAGVAGLINSIFI